MSDPVDPSDDAQPLPEGAELDQAIKDTLISMVQRFDDELYALSETELAAAWHFRWNAKGSIAWNVYEFSDRLEMHKRRCRRWEEHHHGSFCVVERVRDKYLMPRINAFLFELVQRLATDTPET